jgi:hypothetical protein
MKNEQYFLNQTPPELCLRLIDYVPIDREDTVWEPFKGEGAFYNAIRKKTQRTTWSEIEDGVDYKDINGIFDWVITNPPFNERGSFSKLLMELSQRVNKGIAFLGNQFCFTSLTPKRLRQLENNGLHLSRVVICNIKKWYGKYYFMIFTRDKGSIDYLEGSY